MLIELDFCGSFFPPCQLFHQAGAKAEEMRRKFPRACFSLIMGCKFLCSHSGGALWMHAICRPQLFVKAVIM